MANLINKIGTRLAAAAKILEFIDGSLGSLYLGPTLMMRGSFAATRPSFIFGFATKQNNCSFFCFLTNFEVFFRDLSTVVTNNVCHFQNLQPIFLTIFKFSAHIFQQSFSLCPFFSFLSLFWVAFFRAHF